MTGWQCPACDAGQRQFGCTCPVPCPSPWCGSPRERAASEPERDFILPEDILSAVTAEEAAALADLARGKLVIEMGAFHGFSTIVLASVADWVVSVDWHMGDIHAGLGDTWAIFSGNIRRYGVADRVQVIRDRFETALPRLLAEADGEPFMDGAFIDAQHDEDSVARDVALVLPLLKPGGFVAFHDYGRSAATGNDGFGVTPVADRFGVAGVVNCLAWGFKPG